MDIRVPVMDGYEAARRIKNNEKLRRIPVMISHARNFDIEKVRAVLYSYPKPIKDIMQNKDKKI